MSRLSTVLLLSLCCLAFASLVSAGTHHHRHTHHPRQRHGPEVIRPVEPIVHKDEQSRSGWTALQEYVATPDPTYSWTHISQFDATGDGYKVMWLNMTSQAWLTANDTDRSIWWHYVAIIVPNTLNPDFMDRGLLFITGGMNDAAPAKLTEENMLLGAVLAQTLGTVVTMLYQIPNAPMKYWSEQPTPKSRKEDAIIAYGWGQYLKNPSQPQWLMRLPMTKAAVRAMDAATEFWAQQSGAHMAKWVAAGASKRGWTTWTLGACDPKRVVGIIPMVLDELNFVKNIHHHWRSYGGWSFALQDYIDMDIMDQLDSPEFAQAMAIVDPINYVDILTMPKLIISTGGDEFLMPDNNDWYWTQLQGEKHFHQFPNLEHSMIENLPLVLDTVRGFVFSLQAGIPRPQYSWQKDASTGQLSVQIDPQNPPSSVELWQAKTIDGAKRRDFRLVALMNNTSPPGQPSIHPVFWTSTTLAPTTNTSTSLTYTALVDAPTDGSWIGFNIQLVFPGANGTNFRVSSATSIVPLTFPYPDCFEASCQGPLV